MLARMLMSIGQGLGVRCWHWPLSFVSPHPVASRLRSPPSTLTWILFFTSPQIYHEDHAVIPNSSLTEDALGDPFEKDDHDLTAPSPYLASTSPNAIATAGIDTDNAEIGATTSAAGGSAGAAEPVRVTETDRLKALKSLSQARAVLHCLYCNCRSREGGTERHGLPSSTPRFICHMCMTR